MRQSKQKGNTCLSLPTKSEITFFMLLLLRISDLAVVVLQQYMEQVALWLEEQLSSCSMSSGGNHQHLRNIHCKHHVLCVARGSLCAICIPWCLVKVKLVQLSFLVKVSLFLTSGCSHEAYSKSVFVSVFETLKYSVTKGCPQFQRLCGMHTLRIHLHFILLHWKGDKQYIRISYWLIYNQSVCSSAPKAVRYMYVKTKTWSPKLRMI